MEKAELEILKNLYWQAKDAYNPDDSDHNHLKEALIDALGLLQKYGAIDDGQYYIECESFEPKAPEVDFADKNVE